MKRRLLIAKALVHNPPVLILDEPTAGVDIELRRQLWSYVRELHDKGTTVILTTHYLEEAEALCDRIAIIHNGEITANEDTKTLMGRLDQKTLVITPDTPLKKIPPALKKLNASLRDDGTLAITYNTAKAKIPDLLAQISNAKITIADLRTEEPDLEDVFMALTYERD